MNQELTGQIAVVTGGCRGIGKSIVKRFIDDGAMVYALDYVIPANDEKMFEDEAYNSKVKCLQVDVTNEESVTSAFETVVRDAGRLDILVNNAGITRDNLLLRMTAAEWDAVLSTNLKGAFLCVKAVARQMMSQRSGRIINIGSVVGIMGNAGQSNYSASKAGLIGFTKSIAKEFASRNILVNLIAPGYVITAMTEKLTEDQRKQFLDVIPLKRGATPEDIANAAAFLAGKDSSYITGQVLNVDGGMIM
jgi:3-oxoacyl-[acyl-carrier protein] reductase